MLQEYLDKTGQTYDELMQGAFSKGEDFILNTLVPQALKENKKIVWQIDLDKMDEALFTLEDI